RVLTGLPERCKVLGIETSRVTCPQPYNIGPRGERWLECDRHVHPPANMRKEPRPRATCWSAYRALTVLCCFRCAQRTHRRPRRSVIVRQPEYGSVVEYPARMLTVQGRSDQQVESRDSGSPVRVGQNVRHGSLVNMSRSGDQPVIYLNSRRTNLDEQVHVLNERT